MKASSITNMSQNSNKKSSRRILHFQDVSGGFSIDENDYLVVRELLQACYPELPQDPMEIKKIVRLRGNDEERRVYRLRFRENKLAWNGPFKIPSSIVMLEKLEHLDIVVAWAMLTLPEEIGNLSNLKSFDLSSSDITSLPCSIGRLTNLEHLHLGGTKNLSDLPIEIGDLCSLKTLYLYSSNIKALPRTIGRLKSLEELDLSWTSNLSELPDEIGDLVSLKKLDSANSKIVKLPRSIGRLSNLKALNLCATKKLKSLPREICDLVSLEELLLSKASIRKLPEEIGNLQSLKVLDLSETDICTLPNSIARLKNLEHLDLGGTPVSELREVLRTIMSDCRSLGSLGPKVEGKYSEFCYPLACNRARYRTGFGIISNMEASPLSTKLWPRVFQNAKDAFNLYSFSKRYYHRAYHTIQEPEAVYQLLSDGRESLVQHLMELPSTSGM